MKLVKKIRSFILDQTGQFAMITALAMVPLIGLAGAAVDFSYVYMVRMNLERSADAAVIAAVATARRNADNMTRAELETEMQNIANNMFRNGLSKEVNKENLSYNIASGVDGGTINAQVSYTYNYATKFMNILGQNKISTKGIAEGKGSIGSYTDFNVILDVSESMGIGASPSDIQYMHDLGAQTWTHNKPCAFACHNNISQWRKHPIEIRMDVANEAMQDALDIIEEKKHPDSVIRIGFYTFDRSLTEVIDPDKDDRSDNYSWVAGEFDRHAVLKGRGHPTRIDRSISEVASYIPVSGIGELEESPKQIALLITDGADFIATGDPEFNSSDPWYPWGGGRRATAVNPKACKGLKDNGVELYVLYTTYFPANNGYSSGKLSEWFGTTGHTLNLTHLKDCATSKDHFYEASDSQTLRVAMNEIFKEVSTPTHLSK
ncbi:TadE/TadG family type IV pilus assembly protein [Parvularcula sp. IMCC14364]|uniref:TadE/TadG family type IV pilus assembly protein n=1 Tax=Parvularcula sp. IMCC14364 TaxID=3067902 RepID=UPI002740CC31|nr:pilus assembly protein TadG-related protein [Parvularcula sp. IMCC14364]